jgi:hypothetical protein
MFREESTFESASRGCLKRIIKGNNLKEAYPFIGCPNRDRDFFEQSYENLGMSQWVS